MSQIKELQEIIDNSENIVFYAGIRVSKESGIPDFINDLGISTYTSAEVLTHSYFENNTEEFFDYYRKHFDFRNVEPNPTHYKLAEGEKAGKIQAIITQNVDGLHQKAGSKNVLELHGNVNRNICQSCGREYEASKILESNGIPYCECGGIIKPDIVLKEEKRKEGWIYEPIKQVSKADVFIIGGTSICNHDVWGLHQYFSGDLVLINERPTKHDKFADLVINEPVGEVFSQLKF